MAAAHVRLMHNPLMARLFPSDIDAIGSSAPLEAATALRLRDELPDDWWLINGRHWTLPAGRAIGQGEEYVNHYGLHRKSVSQQMGRSRHAVMSKTAKRAEVVASESGSSDAFRLARRANDASDRED